MPEDVLFESWGFQGIQLYMHIIVYMRVPKYEYKKTYHVTNRSLSIACQCSIAPVESESSTSNNPMASEMSNPWH